MATKRKINPAVMAALQARAQGAGAGPVAGIPGGAPDAGMPGGAPIGGMPGGPTGGMPGGPAGMKRGGGVRKMAEGGGAGQGSRGVPAKPSVGEQEMVQDAKDAKDRAKIAAMGYKRGGSVKSSASSRGDGIAQRGKTVGKYC